MDIPELVKKEGMRRGLSHRTIKTYNHCLKRFFKWYKGDVKKVKKSDVKQFLDYLIEKNRAGGTLNVYLNSIKFLYEQVLNRRTTWYIKFSKTPQRLPEVLTKEETKRLFGSIKNKKHLLIAKLLYSAGLRVSEVVNLKAKDIEFGMNYGWGRQGEG